MSFIRIKKTGKYRYKLLVENIKDENGKRKQVTLQNYGRVDKLNDSPSYGLYYFVNQMCEYCQTMEEIIDLFDDFEKHLGLKMPKLNYINLSDDEMKEKFKNWYIPKVPTIIDISDDGIFYEHHFIGLGPYADEFINVPCENKKDGLWLDWKFGSGTSQRFFDNITSDPTYINLIEKHKEIRLKEIKKIKEDKKNIKSLKLQLQKTKEAMEKYERGVRDNMRPEANKFGE